MIRSLLAALFLTFTAGAALAEKAGVGAWENGDYTMLEWIEGAPGLDWYYDWRVSEIYTPQKSRRSVEFVPMIHSRGDVGKNIVSRLKPKNLLGFNEPDGNGGNHQAGLSVEEAIALWPKLEAYRLRLGSPATTMNQTLGRNSWQRRFMDAVEARGLRVDFMAVHYYSTDGSVTAFRRWLEAVHAEYNRPIWVTEFAYIDWSRPTAVSYEQNAAFAEKAILMLEELPFVERHAWFAANPYPWKGRAPRINLVSDDLKPTTLGERFLETLARVASRQVAGLGR